MFYSFLLDPLFCDFVIDGLVLGQVFFDLLQMLVLKACFPFDFFVILYKHGCPVSIFTVAMTQGLQVIAIELSLLFSVALTVKLHDILALVRPIGFDLSHRLFAQWR